jgi:hypothetical protein
VADTRNTIKTQVELNVGRSNDALENLLCDEALQIALSAHPFDDATTEPTDLTITTSSTEVSISSITNIFTIVSARIVEASGDQNTILILKNRLWWDEHIVNPEDNQQGWPKYGLHFGTNIYLDRPADSNLKLRLRVTRKQTFTDDNAACPITLLDKFVVKYVTAQMFKQLKQFEAAREWRSEALGPIFDLKGEPGGLLLATIQLDKANVAEDMSLRVPSERAGISVENLIESHSDYGNIRSWT